MLDYIISYISTTSIAYCNFFITPDWNFFRPSRSINYIFLFIDRSMNSWLRLYRRFRLCWCLRLSRRGDISTACICIAATCIACVCISCIGVAIWFIVIYIGLSIIICLGICCSICIHICCCTTA